MKQAFPATHWERFGPGTIYDRARTGFNRSHPVNRSQPGTGKPGTIYTSWWVIDRDGGDDGDGHRLLLWSGKAVMHQAKGKTPYGGRERAIPPATGRETGLPPEVTGYQPPMMQIMATGANLVRAQVCTGAVASARVRALARVGARSGGEAGANRKPCKPCFLAKRWRNAALAPPRIN